MKNYSMIRIGNEYVVQAGDESILKTTSKRKAARFISEATALLDSQPSPRLAPEVDTVVEPSTTCDVRAIPDPTEVS